MFVDGISSAFTAFRIVEARHGQMLADFAKMPTFKREADYYRQNIGKVKSVDDLLSNRRLLTIALSAFQLEDEVDAKGILRKVLTQDPTDPASLAQRLRDPRWRQFANAFVSLSKDGGAAISDPKAVNAVLAAYQTNEFEKAMGEGNPAVRQALFFQRQAPGIKDIYQILGNATLSKVARAAYGLPDIVGALDPKQQARALERAGLDVSKLSDPRFLEKVIDRFLAASDRDAQAANGPSGLLSLFTPPADSADGGGVSGLLNLLV